MRRGEHGFALLLVFVLAAAVAISMYRELPRVAFEAQRNREEMLIERGEQYSRAIQLFVRKVKRYPATIEELESTNQVRFLRRRYADPMTGKDEWRLVHVGPGGVFLDSVVHKPQNKKEEEKSVNTFTYEAPTTGSTAQAAQSGPGFPQSRASERAGLPPMPGQTPAGGIVDPLNPNAQNPQSPGQPIQPGGLPIMLPPGVSAPPGAFGQNTPGAPGFPPNPASGVNPQTGTTMGGISSGAYPGAPVSSQTGGTSPSGIAPIPPGATSPSGIAPIPPYGISPGAQGPPGAFVQPGTTPNGAQPGQNQALSMINQLLTTPRGAVSGGTGQPATPQGTTIGGGIAGVASTLERSGIKVYHDMTKYNEWEFLYDLTQDKSQGVQTGTPAGQNQNQQGQNQNQQGQNQQGGGQLRPQQVQQQFQQQYQQPFGTGPVAPPPRQP